MSALLRGIAAVAGLLLALAATARADGGRLSIIEENDGIGTNQDRHYTQGFRFGYLFPAEREGSWSDRIFSAVAWAIPTYRHGKEFTSRRFEWIVLGQSLFTPDDTGLSTPDPTDRPYAGWLHSGLAMLQENDRHSLSNLELLAGLVGPAALGREVQDGFHHLFGYPQANGWRHQLDNRPAFQLSYDWKRKLGTTFGASAYGVDVIPEAGLSVGNVFDYGQTSVLFRIGNGLAADYGPERIRPALSGTAYVDGDAVGDGVRWYVYAGAQLRGVVYNMLIDAAHQVAPRDLSHQAWVPDGVLGASLYAWRRIRADFMYGWRGEEFHGQRGTDHLAGVNVSLPLSF